MVVRKIYFFFYTKNRISLRRSYIFLNVIKREHNVELEYYYLLYNYDINKSIKLS